MTKPPPELPPDTMEQLIVNLDQLPVALRRIVEEVRDDRVAGITSYNRIYTRHNRS